MGTRAIVARPVGNGDFAGRYVHLDGTPDPVVLLLQSVVADSHGGDVEAAAAALIDQHPAGWVQLPGAGEDGECWCHTESCPEMEQLITAKDAAANGDFRWAYVMHPDHLQVMACPDGTWVTTERVPWTSRR